MYMTFEELILFATFCLLLFEAARKSNDDNNHGKGK